MGAVKITSAVDPTVPGSDPTGGFGRRQAGAVVTAILGLIMLANAHALPWVAVRPGQSVEDRLLGHEPSTEVRTYALGDLAAARAPLYVGWILLLALLVAAGVRPRWRRAGRIAAGVLAAATAFLTFLPGGVAVRTSGFPPAGQPDTEFLAGTWLALLGLLLVFRAVWAITATPAPAAPAPAAPTPAAATTATVEEQDLVGPGPLVIPRPGWARAPERVPWWRRPGAVTAAVAAGVAGLTLLGAVIWQLAHRPADPHGELPALLVARPADSTPATPAAANDRVDVARIVPLGGDLRAMLLTAQLRDVRHAAGTAWTRPDSATVTVTLLRFDSAESADDFQQSYLDVLGPGGTAVADLPGATAFSAEEQGRAEVDAVAHRGDVVVLVSADGGPADILATVEATLREQYGRL